MRQETEREYEERVERGLAWIGAMIEACPERVAGSEDERHAHERMARDLREVGVPDVDLIAFRHPRSLYANMALHFAIATLATLCWALDVVPALVACGVHIFVVCSYWCESNKRVRVLRRLFWPRRSQNLVATLPARGARKRRVVFVSHIDAAYTGLIFHPAVVKQALRPPPIEALGFVRKSMLVATASVLCAAVWDATIAIAGLPAEGWPVWVAAALIVPAALTALFNGEVVARNTIVPGACDNLSGCFAVLEIARAMVRARPDDLECVFVATGCEEAGTGGAWALAEQMGARWPAEDTIVLGLDTLSNGALCYFQEGELSSAPLPEALVRIVERAAPRVGHYPIPSGATDAYPFLVRGWRAMTLGCVDPEIGAPRHYHRPSDDVAHMDRAEFATSLRQIDEVIEALLGDATVWPSHEAQA